MPVEIKELVIKPTVDTTGASTGTAALITTMSPEEREALIREVVERVLAVLASEKQITGKLPESFR